MSHNTKIQLDIVGLFDQLAIDLDIDAATRSYCIHRINREGLRFWTATLPKLAKTVLHALESGSFRDSRAVCGLTDFAWQGGLLRYFRGYLLRIFDANGLLLASPDPAAIFAIRQICEYVYKLALPFSDDQLEAAQEKFVATECELAKQKDIDWSFVDQLRKDLETYYPKISNESFDRILGRFRPRPGPGTFSTSYVWENDLKGSKPGSSRIIRCVEARKLPTQCKFYERRGAYYPLDHSVCGFQKPYPASPKRALYGKWYKPRPELVYKGDRPARKIEYSRASYTFDCRTSKYYLSEESGVRSRSGNAFGRLNSVVPVSEVLFVPKDSRGPRTIVREPYDLLVHQMSFFDWASTSFQHYTGGRVMFTDQSQNQELAREGSLTGNWATLDLKDASDRVSFRVVEKLYSGSPGLREFLRRYRTRFCRLPDGGVLPLAKLSGMGSGFTFPTMAMLIHLSVTREIVNVTRQAYHQAAKDVYVYGDDIIVPARFRTLAEQALSKVGLKVNQEKSYSNGGFRESCGADFYRGVGVTISRLKLQNCVLKHERGRLWVSGSFDTLALERHARELVKTHLQATSEFFYRILERHLGQKLPTVSGDSPALGRYSLDTPVYGIEPCGTYKCVRALFPSAVTHKGPQDPYVYLSASLRQTGSAGVLSAAQGPFDLLDNPPLAGFQAYSVPRRIKYTWKNVSAFSLMR